MKKSLRKIYQPKELKAGMRLKKILPNFRDYREYIITHIICWEGSVSIYHYEVGKSREKITSHEVNNTKFSHWQEEGYWIISEDEESCAIL